MSEPIRIPIHAPRIDAHGDRYEVIDSYATVTPELARQIVALALSSALDEAANIAVEDAAKVAERPVADDAQVICPGCSHQFPAISVKHQQEIAALKAQLEEWKDRAELWMITGHTLQQERDQALADLAALRAELAAASKELGGFQQGPFEGTGIANGIKALSLRCATAERELAAEREKRGKAEAHRHHHNECLFCGTRFSVPYDSCPVCSANQQRDTARAELAAEREKREKAELDAMGARGTNRAACAERDSARARCAVMEGAIKKALQRSGHYFDDESGPGISSGIQRGLDYCTAVMEILDAALAGKDK